MNPVEPSSPTNSESEALEQVVTSSVSSAIIKEYYIMLMARSLESSLFIRLLVCFGVAGMVAVSPGPWYLRVLTAFFALLSMYVSIEEYRSILKVRDNLRDTSEACYSWIEKASAYKSLRPILVSLIPQIRIRHEGSTVKVSVHNSLGHLFPVSGVSGGSNSPDALTSPFIVAVRKALSEQMEDKLNDSDNA